MNKRNCNQCNVLYKPLNKYIGIKYCSKLCSAKSRKGKKRKDFRYSYGYRYVFTPNHPFANDGRYVAEHRLIMEDKIGRYLKPNEVVHHINGNKIDNRIENLSILSRKSHALIHYPEMRERLKIANEKYLIYRKRNNKGQYIKGKIDLIKQMER